MLETPKSAKTPSDRKSTRLNSSHGSISYAVFCLKKKKNTPVVTALQSTIILITDRREQWARDPAGHEIHELVANIDGVPGYKRFTVAFFFYGYGDHRDLHSFPTRRSSDLLDPGSRHLVLAGVPARSDAEEVAAVREDRKSTRLNSSHGSISYAVFCLKK